MVPVSEPDAESAPLLSQRKLLQAAEQDVKRDFVCKVYGILALQLLLTTFIATPFQFIAPAHLEAWSWLASVAAAVVLSCVITAYCYGEQMMRNFPQNFLFLGLLTAAMSVTLGFFASTFAWYSVLLSAGLSAIVFLGLTVFAWSAKSDFTGLGPYLTAAVLVFVAFGSSIFALRLLGIHVPFLTMIYDAACLLFFSFYIIYDTQLITNDKERSIGVDDYVFAALCLYTDIINLFVHLLSLLGKRKH